MSEEPDKARQGPLNPVSSHGLVEVQNPPAEPLRMTPDEAEISGVRMMDAADRARRRTPKD